MTQTQILLNSLPMKPEGQPVILPASRHRFSVKNTFIHIEDADDATAECFGAERASQSSPCSFWRRDEAFSASGSPTSASVACGDGAVEGTSAATHPGLATSVPAEGLPSSPEQQGSAAVVAEGPNFEEWQSLFVKNTFIHIGEEDCDVEALPAFALASRWRSSPASLGKPLGGEAAFAPSSPSTSPPSTGDGDDCKTEASLSESWAPVAVAEDEAPREGPPELASGAGLATRGTSYSIHQQGLCTPCFYYSFKADGCRRGSECANCHFCTNEEAKEKKKMGKRAWKEARRAEALAAGAARTPLRSRGRGSRAAAAGAKAPPRSEAAPARAAAAAPPPRGGGSSRGAGRLDDRFSVVVRNTFIDGVVEAEEEEPAAAAPGRRRRRQLLPPRSASSPAPR